MDLRSGFHKKNTFKIETEYDLHTKVVDFIRKKYNDIILMIPASWRITKNCWFENIKL